MQEAPDDAKLVTESRPKLTLARIAEQWVKRLAMGEIRYDPCKVELRWVAATDHSFERFKVIFNGNRKDRLERKAA